MLHKLFSLFRTKSELSPLELARQARGHAAEVYAAAVQREDTRDQHWALRRFRKATTELLRLEKAEGSR